MANRIVRVHAGIYGMGIYAIMLPSSGLSVAHCDSFKRLLQENPSIYPKFVIIFFNFLFFVNYRNFCKHSRPLIKEIFFKNRNFGVVKTYTYVER